MKAKRAASGRASLTRKKQSANGRSSRRSAAVVLLVGTRKGAFVYRSDPGRRTWKMDGPHFLGCIVNHLVLDPRDRRTLLMAVRTGHLGPTVMRSIDRGKTWKEAEKPPAFPKAPEGEKGLAVDKVFWLSPGHANEPGVWYAGTTPQGLFRSEDGGVTWTGVSGFNDHPMKDKWTMGAEGLPDGPTLHSVRVDPRDAAHLYLGMSIGGVFESTNRGADWRPINRGVVVEFGPEKYPEYGQDTHELSIHPTHPDRLYQQNHCGIYRLDRPSEEWTRIGDNMPRKVGDIGFPMLLHPRDPDTAWVFPMDGTEVWPRTSPDGRPAAYRTQNGGKTWQRQDKGLPPRGAYYTVKRQSFATDTNDPVGLYFGTTSGEVWMSADEGARWREVVRHLPHIYSVEVSPL